MKKHAAPIIVAMLLLLPVLYLGSYLALVKPGIDFRQVALNRQHGPRAKLRYRHDPYAFGGRLAATCFWPLEQIDRKVRPKAWSSNKIGR